MTRRGLHVWDRIVFATQLTAITGISAFSFLLLNSRADHWAWTILLPGLLYSAFRLKRRSIAEPVRLLSARTSAFCNTANGLASLSDTFFRRLLQYSEDSQTLANGLEANLETCRHMASAHWDLLQKVQELEVLVGRIQDSTNGMHPQPLLRDKEVYRLSWLNHSTSGAVSSGLTTSRSIQQWANDLSQTRKEIYESVRDLQQTNGRLQDANVHLSNVARQSTRRVETMTSEAGQILSKAEQSAAIFREVNFVLQDVVEPDGAPNKTHWLQQPHPILETHLIPNRLESGELEKADLVEIR